MGLAVIEFEHETDLLNSAIEFCDKNIGLGKKIAWLCPSRRWADIRKEDLSERLPFGVEIETLSDFVNERWELDGDGRNPISQIKRLHIVKKAIAAYNDTHGMRPVGDSPAFIKQCASFLSASAGHELHQVTSEDRTLIELKRCYEEMLGSDVYRGLLEQSEVLRTLEVSDPNLAVVIEGDIQPAEDTVLFLKHLAAEHHCLFCAIKKGDPIASWFVDQQMEALSGFAMPCEVPPTYSEPDNDDQMPDRISQNKHKNDMRDFKLKLFGDDKRTECDGEVQVAESQGPHVEASLIADICRSLLDRGIPADQICVTVPGAWGGGERLVKEAELRGIPMRFHRTVDLLTAPLGRAISLLWDYHAAQPSGDKNGINVRNIVQYTSNDEIRRFISTPYCGLTREQSWKLDTAWRESRTMDETVRMEDAARCSGKCAEILEASERLFSATDCDMQLESASILLDRMIAAGKVGNIAADRTDEVVRKKLLTAIEELKPNGILFDFDLLECLSVTASFSSTVASTVASTGASSDVSSDVSAGISTDMSADICGAEGTRAMADAETSAERKVMNGNGSIVVTTLDGVAPRHYRAVVMTGLIASNYPMDRDMSAFSKLLVASGIMPDMPLQISQRRRLIQAVSSVDETLVLERSTYDASGDEVRESALFDDAMNVYVRSGEDDAGTVPLMLMPYRTVLAEGRIDEVLPAAEIQTRVRRGVVQTGEVRYEPVTHGALASEEKRDLLALVKGTDDREFYATELERYLECPYKWFSVNVLASTSIDAEFGTLEKGNFFHAVLCDFYRRFRESGQRRVSEDNLSEALRLVDVCVDAYLADENNAGFVLKGTSEERQIAYLRRLLKDSIRSDASFMPGYEPTLFEWEFGRNAGLPVQYAGVGVKGRIDRIDVDEKTNRAVIVDYKYSDIGKFKLPSVSTKKSQGIPRITTPYIQAALYASVVERLLGYDVVAITYRSIIKGCAEGAWDRHKLDIGDLKASGLDEKSGVPRDIGEAAIEEPEGMDDGVAADAVTVSSYSEPKDFQGYLETVEAYAGEAILRMEAGDIPQSPVDGSDKCCAYCPATLVCTGSAGEVDVDESL